MSLNVGSGKNFFAVVTESSHIAVFVSGRELDEWTSVIVAVRESTNAKEERALACPIDAIERALHDT